jgi:hypothetical protein
MGRLEAMRKEHGGIEVIYRQQELCQLARFDLNLVITGGYVPGLVFRMRNGMDIRSTNGLRRVKLWKIVQQSGR